MKKSWVLILFAAVAFAGCSRAPEARAARFFQSGQKYLDKKDYVRAILEFQNAIRLTPNAVEPHCQMGVAYLAAGDPITAIGEFRKAVDLDPKHAEAQLKLAEMMAVNDDLETVREAQKRAQSVLAVSPDHLDGLHTLALTEVRLGSPSDAEKHLRQALQISPLHLKSTLTLAALYLARRDSGAAEELLKDAVQRSSGSVDLLLALGRLYVSIGRPSDGEGQFRKALQADPKSGLALLDLANLLARSGRSEEAEQTFRRLSALPDQQFKPAHAIFLFQQGKREAAIAEFEKLSHEDSEDREARTRLIASYVAAKRIPDAEKILREVLRRNPRDIEALSQRSEVYVLAGKYTEAMSDLTQVLRYQPDSAEAHYGLAKIHQTRGQPLNQRQELNEALRLDPNLLTVRLELAQALLAANSAKAAVDLMEQTPEDQKRLIPVAIQRNWALLALGDQAASRKGIDEALAREKSPDLLLQDALLRLRQRDYSGSQTSLEKVLDQNPEDLRALEALAGSYIARQQMPGAVGKVKRYAALRPKSAPLQHLFGKLLLASGDRAEARAAFTAASAADPKFIPANLGLAEMDLAEGRLDAARRTLSTVLSSQPEDIEARLALGMVEETAGNYPAAIEQYRKVVEIDRTNVVALNNLAYRLANNANDPDGALKFAQQAKELAPENPSVSDTLGWVFYKKGIYHSAVTYLESASAKEAGALPRYHLAMAYAKAGDRTRGRRALETALQKDPNLPEAKIAQQLFAETIP